MSLQPLDHKITDTDATRQQIERFFAELIPKEPRSLYDPVRRVIAAGGKRVRPLLTSLTARLGDRGDDLDSWLPAAAAVELLHSFTLIHDDIMDNAATRRGKPTMHVTNGVSTAILAGDVMIALAEQSLARARNVAELLREFGFGFRAVCEGQALDKEFENRDDVTEQEYLRMIDLKTAKILELAAVLGAIASGAEEHVEAVRAFAHHLGIAFQIKDDLLDLTAVEADFGKTIGGDILEGKRTYLYVLAKEREARATLSQDETSLLRRIGARRTNVEDIVAARLLFAKLGVLDAAEFEVARHTGLADASLGELTDSEAKTSLIGLSRSLLRRAV